MSEMTTIFIPEPSCHERQSLFHQQDRTMGISQHPFGDRSQHDLLKQGCASSSDDDQVYVLDFGAMDELFRRMTNNNISRDLNPMCPPSLHYAFQSNLKVLAGIIQDCLYLDGSGWLGKPGNSEYRDCRLLADAKPDGNINRLLGQRRAVIANQDLLKIRSLQIQGHLSSYSAASADTSGN